MLGALGRESRAHILSLPRSIHSVLVATCPRHQGVQWHVWRDQWWVVHRVNTYGAVATVVCTLITHSRTIVQHAHSRPLQPSQLRHRDTQKHRGACCACCLFTLHASMHPCTHAHVHPYTDTCTRYSRGLVPHGTTHPSPMHSCTRAPMHTCIHR